MLIIKAYINNDLIDEIHIHNTGRTDKNNPDIYEYELKYPNNIKITNIFYNRKDGWMKLAIAFFNELIENEVLRKWMSLSKMKDKLP